MTQLVQYEPNSISTIFIFTVVFFILLNGLVFLPVQLLLGQFPVNVVVDVCISPVNEVVDIRIASF